jgi:glycosyltransferase involved in cell wall biosynthesis
MGRGHSVRKRGSLRVLMIAPTSFFSDYGCHVRILEEARGLQGCGHRVVICTYHHGGAVPGLTIRRSLGPPSPRRAVVGSSRHKLYLDVALSLRTLGTALAFRPDIIHAHMHEGALIGGVLARLLRRPLLFDYQGSLTSEMLDHGFLRRGSLLYRPTRALEGFANRAADAIVTSTRNAASLLTRDFGLGDELVSTVADGVDTVRFRPGLLRAGERDARRAIYGIGPERKVIAYLGLLAPHQGTGLLLEAARIVAARDPRAFFLIGGFPGNESYRQQAEELGLAAHTSFPGRIAYNEAEEFLALGDIAVSPKLSETEGNGKLYNYAAMGLPTVAFDTPANREILGDLALYPAATSAEALAESMLTLIARPHEAAAHGRALRERAVRQLSWPARLDELLRVYERLRGLPVAALAATAPAYAAPEAIPAGGTASEGHD